MRRLVVRPAAEADLRKARRWYEDQRRGLGDEFLQCVEDALNWIVDHPLVLSVVHRDVRRVAIRRFPYGVFYRVADDAIYVLGVFHGRQSPRAVRRRD